MDDGLFNHHSSSQKVQEANYQDEELSETRKFNLDVCSMARYLCKFTLRFSVFLDFKPSQIAAACLMLALNALGQKSKQELGQFETSSAVSDEQALDDDIACMSETNCVLSKWSDNISILTKLDRAKDVKTAYSCLIMTLTAHD